MHRKRIFLIILSHLVVLLAGSLMVNHFHKGLVQEQIHNKTIDYQVQTQTAPKYATVFFGDSITEYCPVEELYADYAKKHHQVILNRGISSEQTADMLARIQSTVLDSKPSQLIMVMGINDFLAGKKIEDIFDNIYHMIQIVKEKSPHTKIILSSVYPIRASDRPTLWKKLQMMMKDSQELDELNLSLQKMAKEEHILFVNMDEVLKDEQGKLKREYSYDGLHPNAQGYLAIRSKMIEALE